MWSSSKHLKFLSCQSWIGAYNGSLAVSTIALAVLVLLGTIIINDYFYSPLLDGAFHVTRKIRSQLSLRQEESSSERHFQPSTSPKQISTSVPQPCSLESLAP